MFRHGATVQFNKTVFFILKLKRKETIETVTPEAMAKFAQIAGNLRKYDNHPKFYTYGSLYFKCILYIITG